MQVISLDRIREVLPSVKLIDEIEQGFVAYSRGKAVVPPVGDLTGVAVQDIQISKAVYEALSQG